MTACQRCGREFDPPEGRYRYHQKYCSESCKIAERIDRLAERNQLRDRNAERSWNTMNYEICSVPEGSEFRVGALFNQFDIYFSRKYLAGVVLLNRRTGEHVDPLQVRRNFPSCG